MAWMSDIPKELDAEMTPAVRAFVLSLLKRIEQLEKVIKTPLNSSLPPSSPLRSRSHCSSRSPRGSRPISGSIV